MFELTSHAGEIRRHHDAAQSAAKTAIEHALAAGKLLSDAKVHIAHGQFETWIVAECGISVRNAQRYMRLHRHRDALPAEVGIGEALAHIKSDTVTHLEKALELENRAIVVRQELHGLNAQLDSATTLPALRHVINRADDLCKDATDINVRAQRGLGLLLSSDDIVHVGTRAEENSDLPGWFPKTGEAVITVAPVERYWFVWRDDDVRYCHALFMDMHPLAGDGNGSVVSTKRPVPDSYLRGSLELMELVNPDHATWWRFPITIAKNLREIAMQQ